MWILNLSSGCCCGCFHPRHRNKDVVVVFPRKLSARKTIILSSLSKKKEKNDWGFRPPDIPTLEERYRAELAYVEEKFGPKRYQMPESRDPLDTRILINQEKAKQERNKGFVQYQNTKLTIMGVTLAIGAFVTPWIWWLASGKTAWSYVFGVGGSLLYVWLLSTSVERLAETANTRRSFRDWLGPARLAIVALWIIAAAKHRQELELLPVFLGLLTYKIAIFVPLLTENWKQDHSSEHKSTRNAV